jgi:hypothetical protein
MPATSSLLALQALFNSTFSSPLGSQGRADSVQDHQGWCPSMWPTCSRSGSLVASCRVHALPLVAAPHACACTFRGGVSTVRPPPGGGSSCMCPVAVGPNASSLAAAACSAPLAGSMLAVPLARAGAYSLHSLLFRTIASLPPHFLAWQLTGLSVSHGTPYS